MAINTILKPKKKYELIRLGSLNDGGYLIGKNSIKKAKSLISFGIEDNWQFEKEFHNYNSNCACYCFDDKPILKFLIKKFLVEMIFFFYHRRLNFINYFKNIFDFLKMRKKIHFFQKKIFYNDLNKIISETNSQGNIFLKIDIEGSEYRILDEIIENQKRIIGMVIEFHDFDYHSEIIYNFCKKLDLDLIHLHPNNFAPKDKNGDPTVIELSFEKDPIILGDNPVIPHDLDMKNNSLDEDISLNFR